MKDFIVKMLSESSDISSMRVMSVLALLIGGAIGVISLYKGVNLSEAAILSGVFVGAAFGGKVAQKFAEIKGE